MIILKRTVAIINAAVMALSAVNVTMAEQSIVPIKVLAGENVITMIFSDSNTAEDIVDTDISIVSKSGEESEFSIETAGNTVNIYPKDRLIPDTEKYTLLCKDYTADFNIETVWEADFSQDAEIDDSFYTVMGDKCTTTIQDNALIMNEGNVRSNGESVIFPKYDGQLTEENLTFNFCVKYHKPERATKGYPIVISFNAQNNNAMTYDTSGGFFNTSASWGKTAFVTDLYRGFVISGSDDNTAGVPGGKVKKATNKTAETGIPTLNEYPNLADEIPEYSISVNKIGETGILSVNGGLTDIYDTREFIGNLTEGAMSSEELEILNNSEMPRIGYFAITQLPYNTTGESEYYDMSITKCNLKRVIEADLELSENKPYGDEEKIILEFNEEITDVKNAAEKVTVLQDDEAVRYDYDIDFNKLILKPEGGVIPNKDYKINIKSGFGEGGLTVKTDLEAEFRLNYEQGNITLENVSADAKNIYLTFNRDMTDIENVEDTVSVLKNGESIGYKAETKGSDIRLVLDELLIIDDIYDLVINKKLGYEAVRLTDDIHRYFMLKSFSEADFSKEGAETSDFAHLSTYSSDGNNAKAVISDGKMYVEKKSYSTLHFDKMQLEDYEDYVLSFDIQHYGSKDLILLFNANSENYGIFDYQGGKPITGFGWYTNSSKNQFRDFLAKNVKNNQLVNNSAIHVQPLNPYNEIASGENVTFEEKDGKTSVILPSAEAPVYHYTLIKKGTEGTLYINDTLVDVYETEGEFEKYNSLFPDNTQIDYETPNTGYIIIAGNTVPSTSSSVFALSDMKAARYSEYVGDKLEITEKEEKVEKNTASGNIKVRNYFNIDKECRVVVSAYSEDNELIASEQIINSVLTPGEIQQAAYSITSDKEIKRTEINCLTPDNVIGSGNVSISEASNIDYNKSIISIKGKVKKSDKAQKLYILLSNDDGFDGNFEKTEKGHFAVIDIPVGAEEFEYIFKYDDAGADTYNMGIYAFENISGKIEAVKIGDYSYASKEACERFIEKASREEISFNELKQYAQTIGVDISYADTQSKQKMLTDSIYLHKNEIKSREVLIDIILTEKAKMEFILKIKNSVSTAADVNEAIEAYKSLTGLDTSEYNKLSDSDKLTVLKGFIRSDYETKGFDKFAEDFASAIEKVNSKGNTSGSSPSYAGGGGGATYISNEINIAAHSNNDENKKASKTEFADLDGYEWVKEAINYLSNKNIINGVDESHFAPSEFVTREQFVKMAVAAFGLYNENAEVYFSDVDVNSWSYKYIASALDNEIVTGVGNNRFAPFNNITRQDMSVILYRILLLNGKEYQAAENNFSDGDKISDYAVDAVNCMSAAGILNGFEDTTFRPTENATRAQAAKVIYEMLKEMN